MKGPDDSGLSLLCVSFFSLRSSMKPLIVRESYYVKYQKERHKMMPGLRIKEIISVFIFNFLDRTFWDKEHPAKT
jgi:hypothetical protein